MRKRLLERTAILCCAPLLIIMSCSSNDGLSTPTQRASTPASSSPSPGGPSASTVAVSHGPGGTPAQAPPAATQSGANSAAGISWTPPKRWTRAADRSMRAATYQVPAAAGDSEGGECAVFYFGPGQGGNVQANIDRWIAQFEQPDGKPSADRAKSGRETINGIPVTRIDLSGTFLGGGPAMGAGTAKKPGYRLLGAIIEAAEGPVFFKLTGPANTVRSAEKEFEGMLASLKK